MFKGIQVVISPYLIGDNWRFGFDLANSCDDKSVVYVSQELYTKMKQKYGIDNASN